METRANKILAASWLMVAFVGFVGFVSFMIWTLAPKEKDDVAPFLSSIASLAKDSNFLNSPEGVKFQNKLRALRDANSVILRKDYEELMKLGSDYNDKKWAVLREQYRQEIFRTLEPELTIYWRLDPNKVALWRNDESGYAIVRYDLNRVAEKEIRKLLVSKKSVGVSSDDPNSPFIIVSMDPIDDPNVMKILLDSNMTIWKVEKAE